VSDRANRTALSEWSFVRTLCQTGKAIVNGGLARTIISPIVVSFLLVVPSGAQTTIAKSIDTTSPFPAATTTSVLRATVADPADQVAIAKNPRLFSHGDRTVFEFEVTKPVQIQAFTVENPHRVMIDLPDLSFEFAPETVDFSKGLVADLRYGSLTPEHFRLVLVTRGPATITHWGSVPASDGRLQKVIVELTTAAYPAPAPAAAMGEPGPLSASAGRGRLDRPFVVVIDPGHGGGDAGAIGANQMREKDIVLAVGLKLMDALTALGRFDVRMTRTTDRFLTLAQRAEFSEKAGADLFISLHADSVSEAALARTVRGATAYTLSDKASSNSAQTVADKENAADLAELGHDSASRADEQIDSILADLTRREIMTFSSEFKSLILRNIAAVEPLVHDPSRSAGFRVLKQAQTPTVLVELGFLSHPQDAENLQSATWQTAMAQALAKAISTYAGKRTAKLQ
jgi:N-acetylmuramoyl-L-alanine amidase